MKTVQASITRHFDYSDSIEALDNERSQNGEQPMTDDEIKEYIESDLAELEAFAPTPEITISRA